MGATAHVWPWERLERGNVGSHEALIELTAPQPGERVLDIGTGSGGLALRAARAGAEVAGVDVSDSGIERARSLAAEEGLEVQFDVGDAQSLPYDDASFDVVLSAFGINFAPDRRRAAAELARVCRAGGRVGLALMPMTSRTAAIFTLLRKYGGTDGDHPAAFAEDVEELLEETFDVDVRVREAPVRDDADEMTWDEAIASFGPLKAVVERLDAERTAALRADLSAVIDRYRGRAATYVLVAGTRR